MGDVPGSPIFCWRPTRWASSSYKWNYNPYQCQLQPPVSGVVVVALLIQLVFWFPPLQAFHPWLGPMIFRRRRPDAVRCSSLCGGRPSKRCAARSAALVKGKGAGEIMIW